MSYYWKIPFTQSHKDCVFSAVRDQYTIYDTLSDANLFPSLMYWFYFVLQPISNSFWSLTHISRPYIQINRQSNKESKLCGPKHQKHKQILTHRLKPENSWTWRFIIYIIYIEIQQIQKICCHNHKQRAIRSK